MLKLNKSYMLIIYIATAVVGLILCGESLISSRVFQKMSQSDQKAYERWLKHKHYFKPEELEAEPFSSELQDAVAAFFKTFKSHEKTCHEITDNYLHMIDYDKDAADTQEWNKLKADLTKVEPVITSLERLLSIEDFQYDAMIDNNDVHTYGIPMPYYVRFITGIQLLFLKTKLSLWRNNDQAAVETAALILKSIHSPKYSYSSIVFIHHEIPVLGTQAMYKVIKQSRDPNVLKMAMNCLARYKPLDFFDPDSFYYETFSIANIRNAKRYGINLNIQGMTSKQINRSSDRADLLYLKKISLSNVWEPEDRAEIQENIRSLRLGLTWSYNYKPTLFRYIIYHVPILHFQSLQERSLEDPYPIYMRYLVKYDILYLEAEWKLRCLENGLDWETIPHERLKNNSLFDLYSPEKNPYGAGNTFYSIGPDQKDQKGLIYYDPTNGIQSEGDIFFKEGPKLIYRVGLI